MNIFVDVDGTLTISRHKGWGPPRSDMIEKVKQKIAEGHTVVVWSCRGQGYVKAFCDKYEIKPFACLGKPNVIVDDKERIRNRMRAISPEQFLQT